MSTTRRLLALGAAALFLVAGCSSDDGSSSSTTTAAATATTTATSTKPRPTLGQLNTPYELTDRSGGDQVKYSVTSIAVDGQCPDTYYNDVENGHLLVVGLDVETGADWDPEFGEMFRPRGGYWTIVGDNGVTESGITSAASYGCADSQIPQTFDPDSRYQFSIAFDTRNASGMLQLRVGESTTRWEY
ncbi:lipoprotein [Gordonia phage Angelique]|nr:lipoprotein [Gordonia phage Angelique]